jgi:hypothetical protein
LIELTAAVNRIDGLTTDSPTLTATDPSAAPPTQSTAVIEQAATPREPR